MLNIDELKFDSQGLIPAIVVDYASKKVLTLAYMNRESLEITLEEGKTCFWSRSRQKLWRKGETSGNFQYVKSITADCDKDALVIKVKKDGPACHKGTDSCFTKPVYCEEGYQDFSIQNLEELLRSRKANPPAGSYTSYLFEKGTDAPIDPASIIDRVGPLLVDGESIVAAFKAIRDSVVFTNKRVSSA